MKRLSRLALVLLLIAPCAGAQVRGDIRRTDISKVPVAVPPFSTEPGLEAIGQAMAQVLSYDLEFAGKFSALPASAYPAGFQGYTQDPNSLNFKAWQKTKAELLVHVHVMPTPQGLSAECRLFDVFTGNMITGKRLTTSGKQWHRLLAHQFADEIVQYLTGNRGCATSRVCFSGGATGKKEIYIADYDGANATQVTKHNSISILPKISPDGRKIAYLSYKDRYPFLYVIDLNTGESKPLSKSVGLNVAPAWSPDGTKLAMVQSKDGNSEIYLANVDGSGKKRLTKDKAMDTSPTFSPDGGKIAFVSERGGVAQIYIMNADGSGAKRVSFQGGRAYDPKWSPDGTKIAYSVQKPGQGFQIYVMNVDGTQAKPLTKTASNECPTWSADSRHVMFTSTKFGGWRLVSVNIETGEEHRMPAASNMTCQGPSWGPRR